jgi:predicted O-methyltransferase YrrM
MIRLIKRKAHGARMRVLQWLSPSPVKEYGERTMMYVPQRDAPQPDSFLIDLAINLIRRAQDISLTDVSLRQRSHKPDYPEIWPGEHYRLLAAVVTVLQPSTVVEIGTYRGLSALCLKKFLPVGGKITTFDIVSWEQFDDTCLNPGDFDDGRLVQIKGNLSDPTTFNLHRALMSNAQLIFVDGPKDGVFERTFLQLLATLRDASPKVLILDDIRTWNMLATWREISFPKLDLTSFGHWTGTGLVHWKPQTAVRPEAVTR